MLGRAYAINNSNLVVGSVDGGSVEQAATYQAGGGAAVLTQTLAGGTLRTAYGVNDSGRIVGIWSDEYGGSHGFIATPVPRGRQ